MDDRQTESNWWAVAGLYASCQGSRYASTDFCISVETRGDTFAVLDHHRADLDDPHPLDEPVRALQVLRVLTVVLHEAGPRI